MAEYVYGTDGHDGHWLTGEEIVRCRDCKYYEPNTYSHFTCELLMFHVDPDGFCKLGVRRTDG